MLPTGTDSTAASAAGAAERRYVTLLFADLSESTRIAAALEAEVYAELLSELRQGAEEIIARHGGTVVQFLGDGVVAIFGYPLTREDDGRRATEAAIDLRDRVATIRLDTPLAWRKALGVHSGIHAGLVLVNEGDRVRGALQLIGDPPNIAARLSDLAADGEIVVSEETLGPQAQFFRTEGPRLVRLDGRAGPLATLRVVGRADSAHRFETRARQKLSAFVGRQPELDFLVAAAREAIEGRPALAAIVAPAGVGKTRLAEEFLHRAQAMGCQIFRGYCENYLGAEPLQPYRQMLRAIFGVEQGMLPADAAAKLNEQLSRIAPGLSAHGGTLLQALSFDVHAGGDTPRAAPELTIAAMRDVFESLAAHRPLVMFIDDWQWADQATRVVTDAICAIAKRGVAVIVATREIEAGDASLEGARILRLEPFSDDEAKETIQHLLPGIDPFVAGEIRRHAGGNPLFIEELCHSVRVDSEAGRHTLHPAGGAWLATLIQSRVARLPREQAELVRMAAIVGNVIPTWLLEKLTGCGEGHPTLLALATRDFIYPDASAGALRFKHGLARDAIYSAIGLRERRALHARVAGVLAGTGPAGAREDASEALAYHYAAAGMAEEAARHAEIAGDKALAAWSLDWAQVQYRAALHAIDQLEPSRTNYQRWIDIAKRLATACVFDPSREQIPIFSRAVALAAAHRDLPAEANAEYWLGYLNYAVGEAQIAIRHFESALAKADTLGDAPLATQLRATLGQARAAACEYDAALRLFDEALLIKRQHRSTSRPSVGSAYTLACKAALLGDQGRFDEASEIMREALSVLRGVHHVVESSVLCRQSSVLLWQGRWEDARESAEAAEQVAKRVKSLYLLAMSRALSGFANWQLSRAPDSEAILSDATSWLEARDRDLFISLNHGWLSEVQVALGQFARARVHAARALQRARKGDRLGEAMTWRALARAAAAGRYRASAQACLDRAMKAARARGSPHEEAVTRLCAAELALQREARAEAAAQLDQACSAFERMGMTWHLGEAAKLRHQM